MAFALVGVAGAPVQGAAGAAVTPAFGQTPTAGNLLVLFVSVTGSATTPVAPGWASAISWSGTSVAVSIKSKIATGGDTAPTINAITGGVIAAHLEEWSGGTATVDGAPGTSTAIASPITAVTAGESAAGTLVVMVGADLRSTARATANTWTSNHGTPVLRASNNGVSSVNHYSHATLVTASNVGGTSGIMTLSITTSITGLVVAAAAYQLAPPAVSGTGAGSRVASTSTGSAAETFVGTGGGTGTAASASGSGTSLQAGASGTGAGTQITQTSSGTGAETFPAVTGTGAGEQAAANATGEALQVFPGGGVQVPQSAYGEGMVEGGVIEIPPGQGSSLYSPRLRVISGTGGGRQHRGSARGRGMVNDDDLVVLAA
jgi:hypothetical protein